MASGNAVREAINQGFARAELGSLADKQVTQLYKGAHAQGSVVASKCTNAIENYKAAVACFLRALPSLEDERSANLIREEIKRLLARLGELKMILRTADPSNDLLEDDDEDDANSALKNRLLQDLRFEVGDEVEIDSTRPAHIVAVDMEQGTYTVEYEDGDFAVESNVIEPRVRLRTRTPHQDVSSQFSSETEAERHRLWSEIVESERAYYTGLQHLLKGYAIPFENPAQHAGAKTRAETLFSQAAITNDERARIFGNIEDIVGVTQVVLSTLESRFEQWHAEQRLADVFLELGGMYNSAYPAYAEVQVDGLNLLRAIRAERRSGVASVEMRALALGAPPLDDLLVLPLRRPERLRQLLQNLARRTPEDHPDMGAIRDAFVLFGKVEEAMRFSLNRAKLEKQVAEVEAQFSPALKLQKKGRYLVKFSDRLSRIEGSSSAKRCVWLFTDILIVGRKSEWLNVGYYRHIGQIAIVKARAAPEFGPLAFEISGSSETFVFVAPNEEEKQEWLKALRGFIPRPVTRKKSTSTRPTSLNTKGISNPVVPPPPKSSPAQTTANSVPIGTIRPQMPSQRVPTAFTLAAKPVGPANLAEAEVPGWPERTNGVSPVSGELGAATLRQKEIMMQKKHSDGWVRAMAIADFNAMEIGDLTFRKGDVVEISTMETSPGWSRGRLLDANRTEGAVPTAYFQRLS